MKSHVECMDEEQSQQKVMNHYKNTSVEESSSMLPYNSLYASNNSQSRVCTGRSAKPKNFSGQPKLLSPLMPSH